MGAQTGSRFRDSIIYSSAADRKKERNIPLSDGVLYYRRMFEVPVADYSLNLNAQLTSEQQANLEDQALLSALQRAEPGAYETLIRRFQSPVYNHTKQHHNNPTDAGDVVQEVFLKVFRN